MSEFDSPMPSVSLAGDTDGTETGIIIAIIQTLRMQNQKHIIPTKILMKK